MRVRSRSRSVADFPIFECRPLLGVRQLRATLEGHSVKPLLIVVLSCMMATRTHAQVVVTPVVFDTTDRRLASALREALARAHPRVQVIAEDWTEAMFQIGPDTLTASGLYEVGRLLRAELVIGVHACPPPSACVTVLSSRVKWPLVPDTVRMHGPTWVQATLDTLSLRLPRKSPGS